MAEGPDGGKDTRESQEKSGDHKWKKKRRSRSSTSLKEQNKWNENTEEAKVVI